MRILFLTQWFQPEPFFKGLPFARALKERGHAVEVLTGFPNYPGGRVYPGYRIRLYQRETMEGITIHRVALYPSHDRSAIHRIANYLTFSLSTVLLGPWLIAKPDVIYVYNLVTLGLPAFLLRFLFGSRVLIDVQDLWPESVATSKMLRNQIALNILKKVCNWVYRKADQLTVLSPGFRQELMNRGIDPQKVTLIYNWCDETGLGQKASSTGFAGLSSWPEGFVLLFAGTMGFVQGLDTLLDCAVMCRDTLPDVKFVLVGSGVDQPRLRRRAQKMGLDNVTFLAQRPIEEMAEIYERADALIVHLKDEPLFRITVPSKTQAYLHVGKPIIVAVRGDAADLVIRAGGGIVCEPENPHALFEAVRSLRQMPENKRSEMGIAGHRYYMDHLSFNQGVNKFEITMSLLTEKITQANMLGAKRLLDIFVTFAALVLLFPFLVIVAALVKLLLGAPVLFRQLRPGLHGKPFVLLKFRTMTDARDGDGNLLPDAERLTGFGRFLRRTSLDELPELWNVLKGDMSLVGPRPLLMQYLDRYTPEQARRQEVKPGITGWAQVNGRNALTWEEKFKLDVWYVDHQSFWLDIKIIAMTFWKILKCEGISQPGQATMEEFLGGR